MQIQYYNCYSQHNLLALASKEKHEHAGEDHACISYENQHQETKQPVNSKVDKIFKLHSSHLGKPVHLLQSLSYKESKTLSC